MFAYDTLILFTRVKNICAVVVVGDVVDVVVVEIMCCVLRSTEF